jgi:hypothetical protein
MADAHPGPARVEILLDGKWVPLAGMTLQPGVSHRLREVRLWTPPAPAAWLTAPPRPRPVVLESCLTGRPTPRAHRGVDYRPQEGPR